MEKEKSLNKEYIKSGESDLVSQLLSESRYILSETLLSGAIHSIKNRLHQSHARIKRLIRAEKLRKNRYILEKLSEIDLDIANALKDIQNIYRIFSNSGQNKIPSCHANEEIRKSLELWITYLKNKKCKIELTLQASHDLVELDSQHIQEILSVLIVNSIQADSTKIDITSENKNNLKVSEICTLKNAIEICVADNGYGVPQDNKDNLFKAGHSTKNSNPGFGLFIARALARRAGGEISYGGPIGNKGALFLISLPLIGGIQ